MQHCDGQGLCTFHNTEIGKTNMTISVKIGMAVQMKLLTPAGKGGQAALVAFVAVGLDEMPQEGVEGCVLTIPITLINSYWASSFFFFSFGCNEVLHLFTLLCALF